jgi:hypothetical protein
MQGDQVGFTIPIYPSSSVLIVSVPRDGRLISLIAASKGVEDADERVIHQLLDFAHRECRSAVTADSWQATQRTF